MEKFRILQTDQASKVAQVLANKTSQKILDYLADNTATETELHKKLNLSVSTIHYNVKQLRDVGLIVEDARHYSQKGKDVIHYKATAEHFVISPKPSASLMEKLQAIVPVFILAIVAMALFSFLPQTVFDSTANSEVFDIEADNAVQPMQRAAISYNADVSDEDFTTSPAPTVAETEMGEEKISTQQEIVTIEREQKPSFYQKALWISFGALIAALLIAFFQICMYYFKRN